MASQGMYCETSNLLSKVCMRSCCTGLKDSQGLPLAGVQHVRPVGGRKDDDARVALEAVQLRQQLVDGLLPLVVAAAHAAAALPPHGVQLVDEHDGAGPDGAPPCPPGGAAQMAAAQNTPSPRIASGPGGGVLAGMPGMK